MGEPESLRQELHDKVAVFKNLLKSGGLDVDLGESQIVPIHVGDGKKAITDLVTALKEG